MYKDPDRQREAKECEQCGTYVRIVPGKVKRRFCCDACRKAHKRDEPRTKQPRTSTPDKEGVTLNSENLELAVKAMSGSTQGMAEPEGYIGAVPCAPPILELNPKRGKDIKVFEDLPVDMQKVIHRLSTTNGKTDQVAKDRRTAIAIHYQTTCFGPQGM